MQSRWIVSFLTAVRLGVALAASCIAISVSVSAAQDAHCSVTPNTPNAQFQKAQKLEAGAGVARSIPGAIACYESAAARGHAQAMFRLGVLYYNGDVLGDAVVADPKLAWTWFTFASIFGHKGAATDAARIEADLGSRVVEELRSTIAMKLLVGNMVPKDAEKAIQLYSSFADAGSAASAETLANLYRDGEYLPHDLSAAGRWYERAADLGSVAAMFELAKMAESGAKPDLARVAQWYERALQVAGTRQSEAIIALARLRERLSPPDLIGAMQLYMKAARLGESAAMHRLGEMYAQGRGTSRDPVMADAWFTVASYFESRDGKASLQELEPTLTRAQVDQAKLKAHELMDGVKRVTE